MAGTFRFSNFGQGQQGRFAVDDGISNRPVDDKSAIDLLGAKILSYYTGGLSDSATENVQARSIDRGGGEDTGSLDSAGGLFSKGVAKKGKAGGSQSSAELSSGKGLDSTDSRFSRMNAKTRLHGGY